jgi:hypothetical protein
MVPVDCLMSSGLESSMFRNCWQMLPFTGRFSNDSKSPRLHGTVRVTQPRTAETVANPEMDTSVLFLEDD